MDIEDYKSNSDKSRKEEYLKNSQEEKKIEKVVTGATKIKKKSGWRKVADLFIPADVTDVKSYIFETIIIPASKKVISDIMDAILYGESGRSGKRNSSSKISYRDYYDDENRRKEHHYNQRRSDFDYDDIVFEDYGDAEATLDRMMEAIDRYHVISIADYYDMADISNTNFMLNKYGWSDISSAKIVRVRDGWVIRLPRALPLN